LKREHSHISRAVYVLLLMPVAFFVDKELVLRCIAGYKGC